MTTTKTTETKDGLQTTLDYLLRPGSSEKEYRLALDIYQVILEETGKTYSFEFTNSVTRQLAARSS